jgi:hypothetical protein
MITALLIFSLPAYDFKNYHNVSRQQNRRERRECTTSWRYQGMMIMIMRILMRETGFGITMNERERGR